MYSQGRDEDLKIEEFGGDSSNLLPPDLDLHDTGEQPLLKSHSINAIEAIEYSAAHQDEFIDPIPLPSEVREEPKQESAEESEEEPKEQEVEHQVKREEEVKQPSLLHAELPPELYFEASASVTPLEPIRKDPSIVRKCCRFCCIYCSLCCCSCVLLIFCCACCVILFMLILGGYVASFYFQCVRGNSIQAYSFNFTADSNLHTFVFDHYGSFVAMEGNNSDYIFINVKSNGKKHGFPNFELFNENGVINVTQKHLYDGLVVNDIFVAFCEQVDIELILPRDHEVTIETISRAVGTKYVISGLQNIQELNATSERSSVNQFNNITVKGLANIDIGGGKTEVKDCRFENELNLDASGGVTLWGVEVEEDLSIVQKYDLLSIKELKVVGGSSDIEKTYGDFKMEEVSMNDVKMSMVYTDTKWEQFEVLGDLTISEMRYGEHEIKDGKVSGDWEIGVGDYSEFVIEGIESDWGVFWIKEQKYGDIKVKDLKTMSIEWKFDGTEVNVELNEKYFGDPVVKMKLKLESEMGGVELEDKNGYVTIEKDEETKITGIINQEEGKEGDDYRVYIKSKFDDINLKFD